MVGAPTTDALAPAAKNGAMVNTLDRVSSGGGFDGCLDRVLILCSFSPIAGYAAACSTSVPDLTQAITAWAEHWNNNPTPFGKATAEGIITR